MTIKSITPYFFYDGQAADAIELYSKALGAKPEGVMHWGSMPGGCPDGAEKQIMHALLHVGEATVMLSDAPRNRPPKPGGRSTSVAIAVDTPAEVDRLCEALAEAGGTMADPPSDAFWGDRFGVVNDPFGITWMFTSPLEGNGEKGA